MLAATPRLHRSKGAVSSGEQKGIQLESIDIEERMFLFNASSQ